MNHLQITQTGNETVTAPVITKLYQLAQAGLDETSLLSGTLYVSNAYGKQVDYFNNNQDKYKDLNIVVTNSRYIDFEDSFTESILIQNGVSSDNIGITEADATKVRSFYIDGLAYKGSIFQKSEIETFDEAQYFTNVTDWTLAFNQCTKLRKVTFPSMRIYVKGGAYSQLL